MKLFSGIEFTQVGDPLADGRQGFIHCASSHRVTGGAASAHSEAVDQHVGDAVLLTFDITEGWMDPDFLTEKGPPSKGGVFGLSMFCGGGCGGERESSAEVRLEYTSGGS